MMDLSQVHSNIYEKMIANRDTPLHLFLQDEGWEHGNIKKIVNDHL